MIRGRERRLHRSTPLFEEIREDEGVRVSVDQVRLREEDPQEGKENRRGSIGGELPKGSSTGVKVQIEAIHSQACRTEGVRPESG